MGRADYLLLGDWNVVCFQCGHKRKSSMMERNWQGYYVCPEHNEPRQPQDFVRGVPDNQLPSWVQPMPTTVYTYTNQFLGLGDGVTVGYQLGSGLYPVSITSILVNGSAVPYTSNSTGGITMTTPPPVGSFVLGNGSETVNS